MSTETQTEPWYVRHAETIANVVIGACFIALSLLMPFRQFVMLALLLILLSVLGPDGDDS